MKEIYISHRCIGPQIYNMHFKSDIHLEPMKAGGLTKSLLKIDAGGGVLRT